MKNVLFVIFREFLSGCLFSTLNRKPYELSWQLRIFWSLLFGVMLVIAISGNCIVLWIVLGKSKKFYLIFYNLMTLQFLFFWSAHRRMRTVTNYFLLNLSISDLLMASLNCVFNFIFMIDSGTKWFLSKNRCQFKNIHFFLQIGHSVTFTV